MASVNKGKSICIFSAKGGVGKTFITTNLAGVYELMKKKVLIIDLDLFSGGVAASLNIEFEKNIYNCIDDITNNRYHNFTDYIYKYDDYISILPSPKDPRQALKIDAKYIELLIERAMFLYDIVLIDTNHILNDINLFMLDKVDKILFTVTNDMLDLKNMKSVISIFKDLELNNYKVLLNNSRDPFKDYFSLYDMKSILKTNIDFTLSNKFFIRDIDKYLMDGKIISLDKRLSNIYSRDISNLYDIGAELIKEGDK